MSVLWFVTEARLSAFPHQRQRLPRAPALLLDPIPPGTFTTDPCRRVVRTGGTSPPAGSSGPLPPVPIQGQVVTHWRPGPSIHRVGQRRRTPTGRRSRGLVSDGAQFSVSPATSFGDTTQGFCARIHRPLPIFPAVWRVLRWCCALPGPPRMPHHRPHPASPTPESPHLAISSRFCDAPSIGRSLPSRRHGTRPLTVSRLPVGRWRSPRPDWSPTVPNRRPPGPSHDVRAGREPGRIWAITPSACLRPNGIRLLRCRPPH